MTQTGSPVAEVGEQEWKLLQRNPFILKRKKKKKAPFLDLLKQRLKPVSPLFHFSAVLTVLSSSVNPEAPLKYNLIRDQALASS